MNDIICDKIFTEFLIRAKKSTYANSSIEKVESNCNSDKPIWGMNYYGVTLDNSLG